MKEMGIETLDEMVFIFGVDFLDWDEPIGGMANKSANQLVSEGIARMWENDNDE